MAKAIRVYSGSDSYGRRVEVAEREDKAWFSRSFDYNGYHNCWSKWLQTESAPVHPTRLTCLTECAGAPDSIQVEPGQRETMIEWGFSILRIVTGPNRLRLPNP